MKRENCTGVHGRHSSSFLSQAVLCVTSAKASIRNNAKRAKFLNCFKINISMEFNFSFTVGTLNKPNCGINVYNKLFGVLIIYNHRFSKFISNSISLAYCTLEKYITWKMKNKNQFPLHSYKCQAMLFVPGNRLCLSNSILRGCQKVMQEKVITTCPTLCYFLHVPLFILIACM